MAKKSKKALTARQVAEKALELPIAERPEHLRPRKPATMTPRQAEERLEMRRITAKRHAPKPLPAGAEPLEPEDFVALKGFRSLEEVPAWELRSESFSVRLDPADNTALRMVAEDEGLSLAATVRRLIRHAARRVEARKAKEV